MAEHFMYKCKNYTSQSRKTSLPPICCDILMQQTKPQFSNYLSGQHKQKITRNSKERH